MMEQVGLFDTYKPKPRTVRERFLLFHKDNPHVARELHKLATSLLEKGFTKYSIAGLFEVVRFNHHIHTRTGECFKLTNDFKPHYARLLMEQHPELEGFFDTRPLRAS